MSTYFNFLSHIICIIVFKICQTKQCILLKVSIRLHSTIYIHIFSNFTLLLYSSKNKDDKSLFVHKTTPIKAYMFYKE